MSKFGSAPRNKILTNLARSNRTGKYWPLGILAALGPYYYIVKLRFFYFLEDEIVNNKTFLVSYKVTTMISFVLFLL